MSPATALARRRTPTKTTRRRRRAPAPAPATPASVPLSQRPLLSADRPGGTVRILGTGVTFTDLIEATGLSRGYLSLLFRGQRRARAETVDNLAKALGLPAADLFAKLQAAWEAAH